MLNCIGTMPDRDAVLAIPGAHLHDYGKAPRAGRKLGHVTVLADDPNTLDERIDAVRAILTSFENGREHAATSERSEQVARQE
jgi:5-(carboxyamino)imidazole ribonucleotide synthase